MDRSRRLEVWRARRGRLVLVVQSDFVDFDTILMMPLAPLGAMRPTRDVHPLVEVEGRNNILVGQQITAVLATELRERVTESS
jgi:hypothetical protein